MSRQKTLAVTALLAGAIASPAIAEGVLIPVENRRDHVFNPVDGVLYITTGSGDVARWDVDQQILLSSYVGVGNSLRAIDITPDGSSAYITEAQRDIAQGYIRKVDLASGMTTSLTYAPVGDPGEELGAWDLSITNTGKAFFTVDENAFSNRAWPLREIDLSTDMITLRVFDAGSSVDMVQPRTTIVRSADRSALFFAETDSLSGPFFNYDSASDTFPNHSLIGTSILDTASAVSRDGSLFAQGVLDDIRIYDSGLSLVTTLNNLDGGMVFSPTQDLLFTASSVSSEIVVYETQTWMEVDRFDAGETLQSTLAFSDGVMSMTDDGQWLFLSTDSGIRAYNIPAPSAMVVLWGVCVGAGVRRRRSAT